ncbi:hypothetical protein GOP47_0022694, partial [Adiantum capillus-veneris]
MVHYQGNGSYISQDGVSYQGVDDPKNESRRLVASYEVTQVRTYDPSVTIYKRQSDSSHVYYATR